MSITAMAWVELTPATQPHHPRLALLSHTTVELSRLICAVPKRVLWGTWKPCMLTYVAAIAPYIA